MDPVLDVISDPCPTPEFGDSAGGAELIADPAQTMCEIWEGLYKMEQERTREECKVRKQRRKYVRKSVCTSLGCCGSIENMSQDSSLFRAACGFVEGSIEQCYGVRRMKGRNC